MKDTAPDFIPDDQVTKYTSSPKPSGTPDAAPDFIPDDQMPDTAPDFIPDEKPMGSGKYESTGQQLGTAAEGVAQGVAGPLATLAEQGLSKLGVPGMSDEDIQGRRATNPGIFSASEAAGLTGSMLTGVGEAGLLAKGLEHIPQGATFFSKVGSKAIQGMIQMGIIQGGDETSKALLGQGDPASAVAAHIAEAGAVGLLSGGVFGAAETGVGKALKHLESQKIGNKIPSWLAGIGHAASFPGQDIVPAAQSALTDAETREFSDQAFKHGQKFFDRYFKEVPKYVARVAAPTLGAKLGGMGGAAASLAIEQALEKAAPGVSQKIAPAILKAAASGKVKNFSDIINHATKISKGFNKINLGVESLFKSTGPSAINYLETSEKENEKLRKYMEEGGVDEALRDENQSSPEGFAQGGQVDPGNGQLSDVAHVYPEQHVLMSAAKARISNYLNSMRPVQNPTKLPYDSHHKDPHAEREYNKALSLANKPLSVLGHIKKGTLVPKQVDAIKTMYPELHQEISKKITERIAKGQLKDEKKPPYHVRQAMSLFMGTNLDSSLTQPNIMAAQNVFAQQKAQKNQQSNSNSALSKLGTGAMTNDQSREQRRNKS